MNETLGRVMAVTGSQMTVSLEVDHVDNFQFDVKL